MSASPFDVLCLSSIDWDFNWQGHQEIMSALARRGHRVLFIENTGVRAPVMRDAPRLARRLQNWARSGRGLHRDPSGVRVHSPLLLPFPYAQMASHINAALLERVVARWRHSGHECPLVLWTFLPTPLVLELIQRIEPSLSVYYCVDDLRSGSAAARSIVASEERVFGTVSLVFATSDALARRALHHRANVHLYPFGVDFESFDIARRCDNPPPADLARLPRPRVGYVGGIHRFLDLSLCRTLATRFPRASFVFIGPRQTDTAALRGLPNVWFLGPRPHQQLPLYIKNLDVGLIPYVRCAYTDHVYPTKMSEYLALGLPVVSTSLPAVRAFNERHSGVVAVAEDGNEFEELLRQALRASDGAAVEARISAARDNDWKTRVDEMVRVLEEGLERQRPLA